MKFREIVALESDEPIDGLLLKNLAKDLNKQGIRTCLVPAYTLAECQKMIIERGVSSVLSLEGVEEAVLPIRKATRDEDLLARTLTTQVKALSPSKDLTIIDPYFFHCRCADTADYLSFFRKIFEEVITRITLMRFVTGFDYDPDIYKSIQHEIATLNPKAQVLCTKSNAFHDRMWIADEAKGMFVGTSLNGVGKRYALTDFMRDDDTAAVVAELRRQSLIWT
jgi:hypothetical protein